MYLSSNADRESVERLLPGIFLKTERAVVPEGFELRKVYDKGIEVPIDADGFEPDLYDDPAGYCTIGYGHLIRKARCNGSEPQDSKDGITQNRGTEILRDDMSMAEYAVLMAVKRELTDGQHSALADFVFNVGSANFRDSTLLVVVNKGDFDRVPAQLRRWTKANERVFQGLVTRGESVVL